MRSLVLHADALAAADGFLDDTQSATSFAAFTLSVVPAPGSIAAIALAPALALRRRR
jgi:hypothetical protein